MRVPRNLKDEWSMVRYIWLFICVLILLITEAIAALPSLGLLATSGGEKAWNCFVGFNTGGLTIVCIVSALIWARPLFKFVRLALSCPADQRYSSRAVQDILPDELESFQTKITEIAVTPERRVIPVYALGGTEALNVADKVADLNKGACAQHDCSQHDAQPNGKAGHRHFGCSKAVPPEVWREAAERKDEQLKALYQQSQGLPMAEHILALAEVAKGYSNITLGYSGDAGPYRAKSLPYCDEVLHKIDSATNLHWSSGLFILYDLATICEAADEHSMACNFYEKLVPLAKERIQDRAVLGSILSNYSAEALKSNNKNLAQSLKSEANSLLADAKQSFFDDYVIAG